jgi:hypothetical protein
MKMAYYRKDYSSIFNSSLSAVRSHIALVGLSRRVTGTRDHLAAGPTTGSSLRLLQSSNDPSYNRASYPRYLATK